MRYAIVGSRRRQDKDTVASFLARLHSDDEVISGGCKGVDSWAIEAAERHGLKTSVILPELAGCAQRFQFTKAYHARNALLAKSCDVLVALPSSDRTGGTENTILHAQRLGKQIILL